MSEMMPAAFLGHGSPMNALDHNGYTEAWRAFGDSVPRPRAILVVSAHWYVNASAVTAMNQPKTIHDFYGFPDELFAVQYPAPGDPALRRRWPRWSSPPGSALTMTAGVLTTAPGRSSCTRFPKPTFPSCSYRSTPKGRSSTTSKSGRSSHRCVERGILIVASGNVVHNLRRIDWNQPDGGFNWAHRFDDDAREHMTTSPAGILGLRDHPDFPNAVPTPDHFLPLLYLAGLAAATGSTTDVLVDGYAYGSLSMTAFTLDANCPQQLRSGHAAPLPSPDLVPTDDTNT